MLYFAYFGIQSDQISIFVFCQTKIRVSEGQNRSKRTKTGDPSFWWCSGMFRSSVGAPYRYFLHLGSIRHLQSGAAGCNKPCNKFYYRKLLHRPQRSLQPMADAIGPCFVENIICWPRGAKGWWFENILDSLMPISQCNKLVINLLQNYYKIITSNRSLQSWFCSSDCL